LSFTSAVSTLGSCGQLAGVVTCNVGTILNASATTITIVGIPQTCGGYTNTATVSTNEEDPNLANNTVMVVTPVNPAATNALDEKFTTDVTNFTPGGTTGWTVFSENT